VAFSREPISGMGELKKPNSNVLKLSRIVGSSSGAPVLFPPTPVSGDLLVDGGVANNQGLEALFQEDCNVLLVSDASGQMEEKQQVERLRQVETNPQNYRLSASGYLAESDRMNLELREYLSLHPSELKEQAA